MLLNYKGIDLSKHENMRNYIDTYYFISKCDNAECLDKDKTLQAMVKLHYTKKRINVVLFNSIPYFIVISSIIMVVSS